MNATNVWDLFRLDGQAALVTGGARNLGYDMALALAQAGADVAITSRDLSAATGSATAIAAATGQRVLPIALDLPDETQAERAVDDTLTEFGRLDILVNNAGIVTSTPENARLETRPLDLWDEVVGVNLTGAFVCAKHAVAKAMMPAKSGNIVNIASTAGIIGKDRRQYDGTDIGGATPDYHAAKSGVIGLTRDMAVYLAPYGIRANCISPGAFLRDQAAPFVEACSANIPMGRMGREGKEMMGAVVFLASEASSYVTGHNLVVDGGVTAW